MLRGAILVVVLLSAAASGFSQTSVLENVWSTSESMSGLDEMDARVNRLVADVEGRHYRSDIKKLNALFSKTHSRFLHSFVQYSGIEELSKGRFNCLTATSLFSDVLTKAGYRHKIIETNYHIFIIVKTDNGHVVLETTDRFGGFIDDKEQINKALEAYRANKLAGATAAHYQYPFRIYHSVSTNELAGLLYFNQAVKAFNEGDWTKCSEKLSAAATKTSSPRIAELNALLNQRASAN